ncbi:MAG: LysR substrate-binding domain-containing protein [Gammaproteobacteria bacterium]|nr:LysR substrate-binding domain-containing protein [Gammaproteobacteria bacterium]
MDIKWLEDLLILLEEKSFTRAALRRHVTQPAFSRRIRLLEEWIGVDLIDRKTKPIQVLPVGTVLEEGVRDVVNRLYALRSDAQANAENRQRVTFIVQHTLALSLFPLLIRKIKQALPETSYRINPENNDDCENAFLKEGHFLLGYETTYRSFDFSHLPVHRLPIGTDRLVPVVSKKFTGRFKNDEEMLASSLPLLLYQQGGFMADALTKTCLPSVMRNHRVEVICESAFSASLKEMVLADMGVAWLAKGIISQELDTGLLVSLEAMLGSTELNILLFYRQDSHSEQAEQIFRLIEGLFAESSES